MNACDMTADPLAINAPLVERILGGFMRNEVRRAGFKRVVLGLSGGIDSALTAFLAARALGPENVRGVMMPYSTSSTESLDHALMVAEACGIRTLTVPITPMVD